MGQYFKVVNRTKKQFLHPHRFGDGMKLLEFGCSAMGTMTGLALLLRQSTGHGGGDIGSAGLYRTFDKKSRTLVERDWKKHNAESITKEIEVVLARPLAGSWVGDEIAIVGDYDESPWKIEYGATNAAEDGNPSVYEDISYKVIAELAAGDPYFCQEHFKQAHGPGRRTWTEPCGCGLPFDDSPPETT